MTQARRIEMDDMKDRSKISACDFAGKSESWWIDVEVDGVAYGATITLSTVNVGGIIVDDHELHWCDDEPEDSEAIEELIWENLDLHDMPNGQHSRNQEGKNEYAIR
jgi:hypothetical protein